MFKLKAFTPKMISEKTGVTTRQIKDMAEKGIVQPVINSNGAGTSRYYDENGAFSLMLAASVRGVLSPTEQKNLVANALCKESVQKSHFCMLDFDLSSLIAFGFSNDLIGVEFNDRYLSRTIINLYKIRNMVTKL